LFHGFFDLGDELNLPQSVAKSLVVQYVGQLRKLEHRKNHCLISKDEDYSQAMYNLYTQHGFNVQYINHIDSDMIVLLIQQTAKNYMSSTPIWNQFIEDGKIRLNIMANSLLKDAPRAIILAVNTDSITGQYLNEDVIMISTSDYKIKLLNVKDRDIKICKQTLLGPSYGGPINKLIYLEFIKGYESERKLTENEQDCLNVDLRLAALRFWLSRLKDFHNAKEGEITSIKDPNHFKDILLNRQTMENYAN
jgi:hypothetical protein